MLPNVQLHGDLSSKRFNNEGISTTTSEEQEKVEKSVERLYTLCRKRAETLPDVPKLLRWEHGQLLKSSLIDLPVGYECLDASRTWLCYWILHSLSLLDIHLEPETNSSVVQFLGKCQTAEGGFGGGPGQYPHLAPTYAAVNALCVIGTDEALNIIDRHGLQRFLWRIRSPEGAFSMHEGGEVDIRGVYCALSVATLTNTFSNELFAGTAEWIVSCQTYEGGFSGSPGMEAHGGYAFCGTAALMLLRKAHLCDLKSLLRWVVNRQMRLEGGFQGRTNKLVDVCYSFWQGSVFAMINTILQKEDWKSDRQLLMNQAALQQYILICCQHSSGGLLDKPGKPRDVYHTCYALSGLSIAQHPLSEDSDIPYLIGALSNEIAPTHPVYNICPDYAYNAMKHFGAMDKIPSDCGDIRASNNSSEATGDSTDDSSVLSA